MDDTSKFEITHQRYQETLKTANERSKATVFDELSSTGIESVTVTFDGEGDSGQIEDLTAYKSNQPIALPETTVVLHSVSWGSESIHTANVPLAQAIEELCYSYLSYSQGGWENNDGAFGEFTFDIATCRIDLEFNARFTDSTLFCRSF